MSEPTSTVCPLCGETGHQYGKTCPALQKELDAVKALLATRKVLRKMCDNLGGTQEALDCLAWPSTPLPVL